MKRILLTLFAIFITTIVYSQITVYEYKDEDSKAYCTFELDSELTLDSTNVRGLYRAFDYLNVLYFDMAFYAKGSVAADGSTIIKVIPYFYNHANLAKLMGEKEYMQCNDCFFTFKLEDDVVTNITPDDVKKRIQHRSTYSQKKFIDISDFPQTFTKVNTLDWKKVPSDLRKNLHNKDRTFWRIY